jgi:hypothetical protein
LVNFTQELAGAESVDAVIALTNNWLAALPPEIVERLPARCRPESITDAGAIHHWRRQLLAEVCTLPTTPDLRMQELAVFFLRASNRLHALAARSSQPSESVAA